MGYDGQSHFTPPLSPATSLQTIGHACDYRSRYEFESECKVLRHRVHRLRLEVEVEHIRLVNEMTHSMDMGVRILELEQENRTLQDKLDHAQRKLGHRV